MKISSARNLVYTVVLARDMATQGGKAVINIGRRQVKPFMSSNPADARLRVLNLYRAWYRALPKICTLYKLPATPNQLRERVREEFLKNSHVQDVRAIDYLVVKGRMELQETMEKWKQQSHILNFIRQDSALEQPKDFLDKFFTSK